MLLNTLLLRWLRKSHIAGWRLIRNWSCCIITRVHWLNAAWSEFLLQSSHLGSHVHWRLLAACEATGVIILLRISPLINSFSLLNLNWIHLESRGVARVTNTILSREGSWSNHVLPALLSYDWGCPVFLIVKTIRQFFEEITSLAFLKKLSSKIWEFTILLTSAFLEVCEPLG